MPDAERVMRQRTADLEQYDDRRASSPNDCNLSVVAQTSTDGDYPTTANVVYKFVTGELDSDDTEGAGATFTADGDELYALNNGASVPDQGSTHIVTSAGGRWTFRFDG